MAPVDPKNTRGARDFFLMPTGIAMAAPKRENIHDLSAKKERRQCVIRYVAWKKMVMSKIAYTESDPLITEKAPGSRYVFRSTGIQYSELRNDRGIESTEICETQKPYKASKVSTEERFRPQNQSACLLI